MKKTLLIIIYFLSSLLALNCDYCQNKIRNTYITHDSKSYHEECYDKNIALNCSICKNQIKGVYVTHDSKPCHIKCYDSYFAPKCNFCGLIIGANTIYNTKGDRKYHKKCFEENILPKCSICKLPITGDFFNDSWGNSYHKSHDNFNCNSCGRIISQNTSNGGFQLLGNRAICTFCDSNAVKTNIEIENSRELVLLLLKKVGFLEISGDIPINIVNKKTICDLSVNRNCEDHEGLTHYKYTYDAVTNKKISIENTIYIIDYLHELNFASTLAHEYLHVWLNKNNIEYPKPIIEGFCNLGAALIYKNYSGKFSEVKLDQMFKNPDPNYGAGFRKMDTCLEKYGWKVLIDKMKNNDELLCFD